MREGRLLESAHQIVWRFGDYRLCNKLEIFVHQSSLDVILLNLLWCQRSITFLLERWLLHYIRAADHFSKTLNKFSKINLLLELALLWTPSACAGSSVHRLGFALHRVLEGLRRILNNVQSTDSLIRVRERWRRQVGIVWKWSNILWVGHLLICGKLFAAGIILGAQILDLLTDEVRPTTYPRIIMSVNDPYALSYS
jgi:hypothetical protein